MLGVFYCVVYHCGGGIAGYHFINPSFPAFKEGFRAKRVERNNNVYL